MKKISSIVLAVVMTVLLLAPVSVSAASASGSLSVPQSARAGDTITVTFTLNGSGIFGVSGALKYDASQVTLTGTSAKIGSPWMVEFNGNNFVCYDNNLSAPINGTKNIFSATFKINSVAAGTKITISAVGVTASDGSADIAVGSVGGTLTVAEALSGNTNLASLTAANATISPSFKKGTTAYTAKVPFSVTKLQINATPEDKKSKVTVNSPALVAGGTTNVTITVLAQTGAKKTYTIKVTREQDPNYKASANNTLSGLSVEGFVISPPFQPEQTDYIVWLPYETESIKVSGTAADAKAGGIKVVGGETLTAGQDNEIQVICTAENGEKKTYKIIAKRAAAHGASSALVSSEEASSQEVSSESELSSQTTNEIQPQGNNGTPIWLVIVLCIIFAAVGFGASFFILRYNKKDE